MYTGRTSGNFRLNLALIWLSMFTENQKKKRSRKETVKQRRNRTLKYSRRVVTNQRTRIIHELFDSWMLSDFRKVVKEISSIN